MVVGGGAREHALAWKLSRSRRISALYVAPGNAGTAPIAHNLDIHAENVRSLAEAAREKRVDLTVVGPEGPLALGIVDLFRSQDMPVMGPTQAAARVESSKAFARRLMQKKGIPCAQGSVFSSYTEARKQLEQLPAPVVVKADGLAAGKGVIVAQSREEALGALSDIMEKRSFGAAGDTVILEECLSGREVSLLAFTDGKTVIPMVPACDHKRVFDGDRGPNTGGMGSYSPPRFFDSAMTQQVKRTILEPLVQGLAEEGITYTGVLYAGLMVTAEGPKVLEFNVRFGDPETQAMLPRLETDLLEVFWAIVEGRLDSTVVKWSPDACVGVVMASGGYPGSYKKGYPVAGLETLDSDILVFHAGTRLNEADQVVTDGGRVLTVTALGCTMAEAREKVYSNLSRIAFPGCHYRKDIALTEVS
ncbi:MAG: phosphoribosylamine--glycine ligase [Chloroflexota bacterium]